MYNIYKCMYMHTGIQKKGETRVHRQKQQPQQQLVVSRQPDIQNAGLFWSKWRYGRCIKTKTGELSRVFCGGSKTRMNVQVEWLSFENSPETVTLRATQKGIRSTQFNIQWR